MNTAVRYVSRGGNTAKLANAIAQVADVKAETIDQSLPSEVDLLFLGGSVYGAGIDDSLSAYINTLSPEVVHKVAVFGTAAIKTSAFPQIKKLLDARGITVLPENFHCRGQFSILHRGRPNADDLVNAQKFAKNALVEGEK